MSASTIRIINLPAVGNDCVVINGSIEYMGTFFRPKKKLGNRAYRAMRGWFGI